MAEGRSIRAASDGPVRRLIHDRRSPLPDGPWDVVVVGAGIYGLPCAYFLARHAGARVLVVEDDAIPGDEITANTGGIIRVPTPASTRRGWQPSHRRSTASRRIASA